MDQQHEAAGGKKIRVTAFYTSTANDAHFNADRTNTIQTVIDEAYRRLKQRRREDDQYFTHEDPRVDLAPYLDQTLGAVVDQGIGLSESSHGHKVDFGLDIDVVPGGA